MAYPNMGSIPDERAERRFVWSPESRTQLLTTKEKAMPRYVIERTFPDGLKFPTGAEGRKVAAEVGGVNTSEGVSWVHSYVSDDDRNTFCVYDAPSPEAIRKVADRNGLPVDRITEVRVLDPNLYGE